MKLQAIDLVEEDIKQEDYAIFTDRADAIVPEVEQDDAMVEILAPKYGREDAKKRVKNFISPGYKVGKALVSGKFRKLKGFDKELMKFKKEFEQGEKLFFDEAEAMLDKSRKWADRCYEEMRKETNVPIMTGNTQDNIKIMGNNWYDMDVDVWAEGIAQKGQDPGWEWNKVEYYDGRAPHTVKVRLKPYDYSVYANESARHRAINGKITKFRHFRYPMWEVRIKAPIARQLGYPYEIKGLLKG